MAKRAKLKKTIARVGYAPLNYYEESGAIRFGKVTWFVHNEAAWAESMPPTPTARQQKCMLTA